MPIREREGRWHYRVWVKGQERTGSTGLRATKQNEKAALSFAEKRRVEILAEIETQHFEPKTFREAADEFLKWCFASRYRAKPNSARRIATSMASCIAVLGDLEIAAIRPADLERYKVYRVEVNGVEDVTIRHDLHALSVFFQFAKRFEWCSSNPVDDVDKPSDVNSLRMHVLSEAEEKAYFERAAGTRSLYDVARLMILQGCRPEEILALQQTDIDLAGGRLHVRGGKTRASRRTLDLTGESIEILTRRLAHPGKWVFPSSRLAGGHLTKLNSQHDSACLDAGVSFVLYDLRHTFATRLAQTGVDVVTLAAILGHSSLRMVTRYVHPTAEHKKEAMKKYESLLKPRLKVVG